MILSLNKYFSYNTLHFGENYDIKAMLWVIETLFIIVKELETYK